MFTVIHDSNTCSITARWACKIPTATTNRTTDRPVQLPTVRHNRAIEDPRLDLRLPPRSERDLRPFGMLRSVDWLLPGCTETSVTPQYRTDRLSRNAGNNAQIALRNFRPATRHLNGVHIKICDVNGTVLLIVTSAILLHRREAATSPTTANSSAVVQLLPVCCLEANRCNCHV